MDRRGFLLGLAVGSLAAVSACGTDVAVRPRVPYDGDASFPSPAPYNVVPGHPPALINALPGHTQSVALTIDDGVDPTVLKAYVDFITAAHLRLTFFVNGFRPSWTEHADVIRPLVESEQVQLANHTWSHPDITHLSDKALADELVMNDRFLANTYGVSAKPFLRPPYGFHNRRTDKICADHGYTTMVMWLGSFGDSTLITQDQLLALATQWLQANRIVIGHANHPTVTKLYPQILELLRERHLQTVTLDDVFYQGVGRDKSPVALPSLPASPAASGPGRAASSLAGRSRASDSN